jgi:hypothetical protein
MLPRRADESNVPGALEGLPVLLLFDSARKEAVRFTEFIPPVRLARALASVR